ncbi:MAG: murein L,D-transpeptidase family protein, partial [Hyphomicrobium sp.]
MRKTRRRWPRLLFLTAFAAFAGFAIFLAPLWFPLGPASDESAISFERAERRWRASFGLGMRGAPDVTRLPQRLSEHGVTEGAPIFMRIFKREFELELWMKRDGVFHRFATYSICRWSGTLGPKLQQGDHQAPEGFYSVDAAALNPNSRWFRSFNLGYPNAFDTANGRTGSLIMVHGGCASVGCFAMTNSQMAEIWQLVTAALAGGQKRFQVQVFPFRMTDEKLKSYAGHPALPFWRTLKTGHDLFEASLLPPKVHVCRGLY